MIGEYKLAIGWRISAYVTSALFVLGFSYAITIPFSTAPFDKVLAYMLTPISLALISLGVFGFAEALKAKLTITNDRIILRGAFKTKSLAFVEIKGYSKNEKTIDLYPRDDSQKKLEITTYFSKYAWIERWIESNFFDLDLVNASLEHKEILTNQEFGLSPEGREAKLITAKKVARVFNISGYISVAWIFFPHPYSFSLAFAMLLPIIGMIILYCYRGLIKLNEKKSSAYPSVGQGIFLPICGVGLRALWDFDLIHDENIWVTSASAALCLVMLLHYGSKELGFKKVEDIILSILSVVMFFAYSFASYAITNCHFDNSQPKVFHSTVVAKYSTSGKTTTYYFTLLPWGPIKEIDDVSVSSDLYKGIEVNQQVNVFLKKGLLDTQWFYIEKESTNRN